jgi:phage shock protein C
MQTRNRTLYRSRHGVIFGVFRGLADSTGLKLFWLRTIAVILLIFTGIFPLIPIYLVAALLMKPAPERQLDDDETEFYNSYTTNRRLALERLSRRLDSLDRRARRMEDTVTARGYEWDRRMRNEV